MDYMIAATLQMIGNEAPNSAENGHNSGYQKNDIVEHRLPKWDGTSKKFAITKQWEDGRDAKAE